MTPNPLLKRPGRPKASTEPETRATVPLPASLARQLSRRARETKQSLGRVLAALVLAGLAAGEASARPHPVETPTPLESFAPSVPVEHPPLLARAESTKEDASHEAKKQEAKPAQPLSEKAAALLATVPLGDMDPFLRGLSERVAARLVEGNPGDAKPPAPLVALSPRVKSPLEQRLASLKKERARLTHQPDLGSQVADHAAMCERLEGEIEGMREAHAAHLQAALDLGSPFVRADLETWTVEALAQHVSTLETEKAERERRIVLCVEAPKPAPALSTRGEEAPRASQEAPKKRGGSLPDLGPKIEPIIYRGRRNGGQATGAGKCPRCKAFTRSKDQIHDPDQQGRWTCRECARQEGLSV